MKKFISAIILFALLLSLAVPASALAKPAAPKLLSVKNAAQGALIKWSAVKNADGYYVFRKTDKAPFKVIATVKATSYTHKSAVSGTKHTYKIKAFNKKGRSLPSNQKSLLRVSVPTLKLSNTRFSVKASWTGVKKATCYVLLGKKKNAKKYTVLYRGKAKSFDHDNIASGAEYEFKVKAKIGKTDGAYSSVKSYIFLECPTIAAEELMDMDGITLTWGKIKNAKCYLIYRSLKNKNSFKRIAKTASTSYKDRDVESIKSYKYYVKAFNTGCSSAKSNIDGDVYGYYDGTENPLYLTIKKGEVYTDVSDKLIDKGGKLLVQTYFRFKSQNTDVVTVDELGVITAKGKGKTMVIVDVDPIEGYTKTAHKIRIEVTVK